jgi:hypothetical protein
MNEEIKVSELEVVGWACADHLGNYGSVDLARFEHLDHVEPKNMPLCRHSEAIAAIAERDARIALQAEALEHIRKTAGQARVDTKRLIWIAARATMAIDGREYDSKELEQPKTSRSAVAQLARVSYERDQLRAELAALREQVPATATERFVQPVPDKCDRIIWRDRYYGLPLTEYTAPAAKQVASSDLVEKLRAIAIRERMFRIEDTYTAPEISDSISLLNSEMDSLNAAEQEGDV